MTDAELLGLDAAALDKPSVMLDLARAACATHSVAEAEVARRKLSTARKLYRWLRIYAIEAINSIEVCQEAWAAEAQEG